MCRASLALAKAGSGCLSRDAVSPEMLSLPRCCTLAPMGLLPRRLLAAPGGEVCMVDLG